MRTSLKRSLMPAAIGATAIAWIARVLSGRLVADRGDRSDYMRTSLLRSAAIYDLRSAIVCDRLRLCGNQPLVANYSYKGWFSYNRRYRFDRRCQFKKWSYDWDDYMRTLHKRSLMPATIRGDRDRLDRPCSIWAIGRRPGRSKR